MESKTDKAVKTVKKSKPTDVKASNPYRAGSSYNVLFGILFKHRDKGIRKEQVIQQASKILKDKTETQIGYSLSVISNVSKDGLKVHKSARKASLSYFVERAGDNLLKLHIR